MLMKQKGKIALLALIALSGQLLSGQSLTALAANPGNVVINEVAWAGSVDSSGDEWIELYNPSNVDVDLTGWSIVDDGASVYDLNGTIAAGDFFLIEDSEDAVSNMQADLVVGISLANTGDSLVLKDNLGNTIDTVNGDGGAWYEGDSSSKASMERLDPNVLVDSEENWETSGANNIGLASGGSAVVGTPNAPNENFVGVVPEVNLELPANAAVGDEIELQFVVSELDDLYAYGFEIDYDPNFLSYIRTEDSEQLGLDGEEVFFEAALENGNEGKLIIGASRLSNPETGIAVNGLLGSSFFQVIGGDGAQTEVALIGNSFLADSQGDIESRMNSDVMSIGENQGENVGDVVNLQVDQAAERYALELSWAAPNSGADEYVIEKEGPDGIYREIGRTADTSFVDDQNLVVEVDYGYRVYTVLNGDLSNGVEASGIENRGLAGDIDRSDRVDGRDVEQLARVYGSAWGEVDYDLSKDMNYDGMIDGNDLITIGANFGLAF